MQTIKTLQETPTLAAFRNKVHKMERTIKRAEVSTYHLKLYPNRMLRVNAESLGGKFPVSKQALPDVARLADIPALYFTRCDPRLQAVSFNYRIHRDDRGNKAAQIVLRDNVVVRVLNTNLLPAPCLAILDTVSKATPEDVHNEDLRVIEYEWDGQFDISIISPDLTREPRKDDVVAFGVNVSEGRDGAIQVQGAAFCCWCSNGAINRICDSRNHRLRRPVNQPDRQQQFLRKVSVFARDAWNQWSEHAQSLQKLSDVPIDLHEREALRSRLRQAPFFLSLRVINQVLERLEFEVARRQENASLYQLYSAMSYLGTHNQQLSPTYRTRLRLSAGEISRREPRICNACRQLMLR